MPQVINIKLVITIKPFRIIKLVINTKSVVIITADLAYLNSYHSYWCCNFNFSHKGEMANL